MTLSNRIVTVIAGAAVAVGVQALASREGSAFRESSASSADHPARVAVVQDATGTAAQAAAVRYWTLARMAAAQRGAGGQPTAKPGSHDRQLIRKAAPAQAAPPGSWLTGDTAGDGLRWTSGGAVTADVGKIFFTLDGDDYVCSGTLVGGKRLDVVLTAAHCVTSGPGKGGRPRWATNWMFMPGFRDGLLPYGEYTARRFFVIPDWTGPEGGSEQYDVAFVQVTTATLYGAPGAAQAPPGLPVEFADSQDTAPLNRTYVFGYPSEPPYTGLYPDYCAGPVVASGGSAATTCGMTAGDSGGPWFAGFSPRSGSGPVVAVSTYKVSDNLRVLYGAVLGPLARALYERAVSSAR